LAAAANSFVMVTFAVETKIHYPSITEQLVAARWKVSLKTMRRWRQHKVTTDGLRVSFASGDIVHLRPSGNAPELHCYAEANSVERARTLCQECLERVRHG
jgi:phosphomannomutase